MNSIKSTLALFEQNISANDTNRSNSKSFLGNLVKAINNERLPDDMTETSVSGDSTPYSLRHDISEASFLEMMEMIDIATKDELVEQMASLTEDDFEDKDEDKDEDDRVEHQTNKAKASSDEYDEANDRSLMLTWDEQRQLLMARDRKPQQEIGASVSLKDRMRAFNAPSFSMLGAKESPRIRSSSVGAAKESSRVRRVPEVKTEDENLKSKDVPDVGKDNLEDHEASMSSLNAEFQTKNSTNTDYQQDTAGEESLVGLCFVSDAEPVGGNISRANDSLDMSHNESAHNESAILQVEPVAQSTPTSTEYDSEDKDKVENEAYQVVEHQMKKAEAASENCDGKALMLTWEEQLRILTARDRKPQQDIGASVSLKDRMRAFNAKSA